MIAGLPMYDRPELRDAHNRLWAAIRANLGFGPESLSSPLTWHRFGNLMICYLGRHAACPIAHSFMIACSWWAHPIMD